MMTTCTVECRVHGVKSALEVQHISFNTGSDLSMTPEGGIGPQGISATAADLLDFAAAVYQVERQLSGRQRTNPPQRFDLSIKLRNPDAWDERAVTAATNMLQLLGNAAWSLELCPGLEAPIAEHQSERPRTVDRVMLFSGGMDSTCGAATMHKEATKTQLVSFYTRQKTLQRQVASELGYVVPSQWRRKWARSPGRGHSFLYRSFLFLSLAAVVAQSWGVRSILQYEHGVLATAIPPSPAWMMTKHAHPLLHHHAANLFSALFGGDWQIENPFSLLTKRGCVQEAIASIGEPKMRELLKRTETCWYYWSNRVRGGKKSPKVPCGICIPCVIRRTAFEDETYAYDLCQGDEVRNDPDQGRAFRDYFAFLLRVIGAEGSPGGFYALLPAPGRSLIGRGVYSLPNLHRLFLQFAREFMVTYHLDVE